MTPRLLFCHAPFRKDLQAIRTYAATHNYDGVEWGLDGWRLMLPQRRRERLLGGFRSVGSLCSIHAPYTDLEMGHRDPDYAAASTRILMAYVDAAAELGAHHMNCHVGSFGLGAEELSQDTLARNLTRLMGYAARRGLALTVENLRHGVTSDPESFGAILRATGAPVTFDLGHAHGSAWVRSGRGSVADFLRSLPTRILAGHLYFTEENDSHFAPTGLGDLADTLDALCTAGCDFWVLELHSRETLEQTRRVVDEYLSAG